MVEYIDLKTGIKVEVEANKFSFPTTGANVLVKPRPPVAKDTNTD